MRSNVTYSQVIVFKNVGFVRTRDREKEVLMPI